MSRLTIVTPDFPPEQGGVQRYAWELAIELSAGLDVTVVAPAGEAIEVPGARVVRTRAGWSLPARAAAMAEMWRAVRRSRADVVLAMHVGVLPALRAARVPVLAVMHGGELWSPHGARIARRWASRLGLALCVSTFTAGIARRLGVPNERIRLTPGGGSFDPSPDPAASLAAIGVAPPFFLSVGRLAEPYKGEDTFIRSLPALIEHCPDLAYVIAGDGPLLPHLRGLAQAFGVEGAIRTPGTVSEEAKSALMSSCVALTMLSRESEAVGQFEGFGITYTEAALAGRPSIGGRSGGVPDAVLDGETGVLVDPRDTGAIVEAARGLLDDPALADRLGAAARARASEHLTWPAAVGRVRSAIAEVVG